MRQVKGVQGRYKAGKRGARWMEGRHKRCKLGMRQVQGVQGSHKASTRDAEMVQETVKGTVWGKVIDRKVKKDIKILTISSLWQ